MDQKEKMKELIEAKKHKANQGGRNKHASQKIGNTSVAHKNQKSGGSLNKV